MVRRAARHRVLAWTLAVLVGLSVHRTLDGARTQRDAWGATRSVLVAVERIEAGAPFSDRVAIRSLPRAAVPDAAVDAVPTGRRAARPIGPGEIVTADDLAPTDRGPVAARLPPGTAGVQVVVAGPPGVVTGDRVDVVGGTDPYGTGPARLAGDAEVLSVTGDVVTLAVDLSEAAATAGAALGGPVAVVVLP